MSNPGLLTSIAEPAAKVSAFLERFIATSGLDLKFRQMEPSSDPQSPIPAAAILTIEFTGSDTPVLTARNGETLHALEYMAARILKLEPFQHELLSFDADHFKERRVLELQASADVAIQTVRTSGRPYAFPPMSSRERRLLHLAIAPSGLPTSSNGENPRRYVVIYPEGHRRADQSQPQSQPNSQSRSDAPPAASSEDRTHAIRKTFRRR